MEAVRRQFDRRVLAGNRVVLNLDLAFFATAEDYGVIVQLVPRTHRGPGRVDVHEACVAINGRNRPPGGGYPRFRHFFHAAPCAEGREHRIPLRTIAYTMRGCHRERPQKPAEKRYGPPKVENGCPGDGPAAGLPVLTPLTRAIGL